MTHKEECLPIILPAHKIPDILDESVIVLPREICTDHLGPYEGPFREHMPCDERKKSSGHRVQKPIAGTEKREKTRLVASGAL